MLTQGQSGGLLDPITKLFHEYAEAKQAGAKAEVLAGFVDKLVSALAAAAHSPAAGQTLASLLLIGKDRMQSKFDEARLSPCEAAEPARHARQAYDAFADGIVSLREWAADWRFVWLPIPFRRPLEIRVPPHEIKRQVVSLEGLFASALQAAELGTVEILRLRDARVHLGAEPTPAPELPILSTEYLIDLPKEPFHSERQRVRTMRRLLLRIADQLEHAATQGRKALAYATLDKEGEMVRPAAVSAALVQVNYTIACGIITCAALRQLANEPIRARLPTEIFASSKVDEHST